jgi:predicted metal-dependent hydrolase
MGAMKELFMQYQEEMSGQDEFIDDDFHFQQWCEQKAKEDSEYWENVASGSIFPDDMFYDDEYYKSTYHPTKEEEDEAFKLFNEKK